MRIVNEHLKLNILDMDHSERHLELRGGGRISVSRHLAYACTYRVFHLVAALDGDIELNRKANELVRRLATQHLLHWMEVLSFVGRVDLARSSLETINAVMVSVIFVDLRIRSILT